MALSISLLSGYTNSCILNISIRIISKYLTKKALWNSTLRCCLRCWHATSVPATVFDALLQSTSLPRCQGKQRKCPLYIGPDTHTRDLDGIPVFDFSMSQLRLIWYLGSELMYTISLCVSWLYSELQINKVFN